MVAVPSVFLYRSRTHYQQIWTSGQTQTHKWQQQLTNQQSQKPHLIPRREVEFLTQLEIQQVLHDIREVQDRLEKEPKIPLSGRMMYLRKQRKRMRKQKALDPYLMKKYYSNFPKVET